MECDRDFIPNLSSRINISDYSVKLFNDAKRFEAWNGSELVGLVAAYFNDTETLSVYITNVSVKKEFQRQGIARSLVIKCTNDAMVGGFKDVCLEVAPNNNPALAMYKSIGFLKVVNEAAPVFMRFRV
jgi:ribosomal protein S18 acetylase RimI-like enzyme